MLSHVLRLALVCFAALASSSVASSAQTAPAAPTVIYTLDAASGYTEGCQAPCLCPIWFTPDLVGTMGVTFKNTTPGGFDVYSISNVNWVVGFGAQEQRVIGRGTYRVGGPGAPQHQLRLLLKTDTGPAVNFDSGLVPTTSTFPTIDISIAMNNFVCYDRVFTISATPVTQAELVPYRLQNSDFLEGCQPPCKCLIANFDATGGFRLIDLGPASDPTHLHYALVNLTLESSGSFAGPGNEYRGVGMYSVDALAIEHRLVCDTFEKSGAWTRFDSGRVSGGLPGAPVIDIDVAQNGFYCYDRVFEIYAQ